MIQVTLYDVDLGCQFHKLYFAIQSNSQTVETHLVSQLPISTLIEGREFKIILKDGSITIGSISFPPKQLNKQLNLVRWITLFDPKDDQYDGNFIEDDIEQPRILLRIETNYQYQQKMFKNNLLSSCQLNQKENTQQHIDKKKVQQILDDHKDMQNKYNSLKEDLLAYRDISQQEVKQLEQEKQSYLQENKALKQQIQILKQNELPIHDQQQKNGTNNNNNKMK
ncbi:unnamed protein product [Paramecium octaurelia]|uniref:Uncharacterized protein n=1 Tax=Paramecium octaurelia TaxID=43137 RepID=A0A8S1T344_PAROT|nr:unnamed protein product [Paramecium octaurelia]